MDTIIAGLFFTVLLVVAAYLILDTVQTEHKPYFPLRRPRDVVAERDCRVYWGSHGCGLDRGHAGHCVCLECVLDPHYDKNDPAWVGEWPYYGPGTKFYGEDVAARGLPSVGDE